MRRAEFRIGPIPRGPALPRALDSACPSMMASAPPGDKIRGAAAGPANGVAEPATVAFVALRKSVDVPDWEFGSGGGI